MNTRAAAPLLTAAAGLVLLAHGCSTSAGQSAVAPTEDQVSAEELFEKQCALCHGYEGDGWGPAAPILFPRPRDFTRGSFKIASTRNGAPSDEDLLGVLERGMPGSAMPSWGWMPERDRLALVEYVRLLAVEGLEARLLDAADGELSEEEAARMAGARMEPGEPVDVEWAVPMTGDALETGRGIYGLYCADCHGDDGRGSGEAVWRDEDDTLNWARDFTSGILKGGATSADLARRIEVGIHGTAMPVTELPPSDRAALVAFVRSLIPPGSEERLVQHQQTISAGRIPGSVPLDPADPVWDAQRQVEFALAPLWWHDRAVLRASVAALHDGEVLALRIRWDDHSPDVPKSLRAPFEEPPYADAVAVQLCAERDPPFFGMGDGGPRTNIWHWQAVRVFSGRGLASELRLVAHALLPWLPPAALDHLPVYQAGIGPIMVLGKTGEVASTGMQTLAEQEALDHALRTWSRWSGGAWEVVLAREMEPSTQGELALGPGAELLLDFAIWNGSGRDIRGQKSVTIWHRLEIDE